MAGSGIWLRRIASALRLVTTLLSARSLSWTMESARWYAPNATVPSSTRTPQHPQKWYHPETLHLWVYKVAPSLIHKLIYPCRSISVILHILYIILPYRFPTSFLIYLLYRDSTLPYLGFPFPYLLSVYIIFCHRILTIFMIMPQELLEPWSCHRNCMMEMYMYIYTYDKMSQYNHQNENKYQLS